MTINRTNESVSVPMYLEEGVDVRAYGLDPDDIKTITIGGRKIRVIYIKCEPEQKEGLMKIFWHRVNMDGKSARQARCTVQGKYGSIRCPENRKCSKCEYGRSLDCKSGSVVSLDAMLEDSTFEPADNCSPEDDVVTDIFVNELIDYLEDVRPGYGQVFRLLFTGITNRREIGEILGIPTGTAKEWVTKVRKLAEEYYFDR